MRRRTLWPASQQLGAARIFGIALAGCATLLAFDLELKALTYHSTSAPSVLLRCCWYRCRVHGCEVASWSSFCFCFGVARSRLPLGDCVLCRAQVDPCKATATPSIPVRSPYVLWYHVPRVCGLLLPRRTQVVPRALCGLLVGVAVGGRCWCCRQVHLLPKRSASGRWCLSVIYPLQSSCLRWRLWIQCVA
jgi:hypothetical protein